MTTTNTKFLVTTSNGAFWQRVRLVAATEKGAASAALEASNYSETLAAEAQAAAEIGIEPAGRYEIVDVANMGETDREIGIEDMTAGAEG
jgi:hypothetical protein